MPALNKIKFTVPAALAKYVGKSVPREAKLMAAKGMLPLPPKDLSIVLFYLVHDPDPEIKSNAEDALMKVPYAIQKTLLESQETHPLIIDFFARRLDQESGLLETIALNKVTHDETVEFLARVPSKTVVEIIANNQLRILRHPNIVDILGNNPLCGQSTIERIVHFISLETGAKAKSAPPPPPPPKQAAQPPPQQQEGQEQEEPPPQEGEYPPQEEEYQEEEVPDYMQDSEYPWAEQDEIPDHWAMADLPDELMSEYDRDLTDEEKLNLSRKIMGMSVADKIKMALLGNKESRVILIKDSNKIVAGAVLSSPKLTDQEIDEISRSRSVSDEIIRQIASSNEWTRNYNIKVNLVGNPKTPVPISIRFLNFLSKRDISLISKSKNVPSPVAMAARKLIQKRDTPKA